MAELNTHRWGKQREAQHVAVKVLRVRGCKDQLAFIRRSSLESRTFVRSGRPGGWHDRARWPPSSARSSETTFRPNQIAVRVRHRPCVTFGLVVLSPQIGSWMGVKRLLLWRNRYGCFREGGRSRSARSANRHCYDGDAYD